MTTGTLILLLLPLAASPRAWQDQGPAAARQAGVGEAAVPAQTPAQTEAFPANQLEQLVAPIALYPDALLSQVLMASTYPLEIVEAARWLQKNPGLSGDKLEGALKGETWDPSVKSLCGFPDVLKRMNENLDWVQDLGDAFLGQKEAVMDCVQNMRRKAYEAGNLESSKEQIVTEREDKIIVIEAADPEVIYVPVYYSTAVYGSWSYPSYYYPPLYPPPPPGGMFFSFTAGVVWGAAIWGDCSWGWGHTDVDIDIDRYNTFVDNTEIDARRQEVKDRAGEGGNWQHDPQHRKGVGYKDGKVAQQYGAGAGQNRVSRDQARGYADRATQRPSATTGDRASAGQRPGASSGDRASAGTRDAPSARSSGSTRTTSSTRDVPSRTSGQRSGSLSGSRNPSMDRASSSRGAASRGSGGARGGGGGGRGR